MRHHARPSPIFLYFIWKPGLMKLQRASLSRERQRERERERERSEAGHEPGSSGLRLPKYWDYKRAPPRPAPPALFFILYFETGSHEVVEGLTKERERERASELKRAEAGCELGSSSLRLPKYWDYKRAPPRLATKASISVHIQGFMWAFKFSCQLGIYPRA